MLRLICGIAAIPSSEFGLHKIFSVIFQKRTSSQLRDDPHRNRRKASLHQSLLGLQARHRPHFNELESRKKYFGRYSSDSSGPCRSFLIWESLTSRDTNELDDLVQQSVGLDIFEKKKFSTRAARR